MASYVLRRIDDGLWQRFRVLAAKEGVTTTDLLMRLVKAYVTSQDTARLTPVAPAPARTVE